MLATPGRDPLTKGVTLLYPCSPRGEERAPTWAWTACLDPEDPIVSSLARRGGHHGASVAASEPWDEGRGPGGLGGWGGWKDEHYEERQQRAVVVPGGADEEAAVGGTAGSTPAAAAAAGILAALAASVLAALGSLMEDAAGGVGSALSSAFGPSRGGVDVSEDLPGYQGDTGEGDPVEGHLRKRHGGDMGKASSSSLRGSFEANPSGGLGASGGHGLGLEIRTSGGHTGLPSEVTLQRMLQVMIASRHAESLACPGGFQSQVLPGQDCAQHGMVHGS